MTSTPRVADGLPERDAETVAADLPDDATLLVSGFGSVGYPKAVPLDLAAAAEGGRDLALTVVSGGTVGDEIDTVLVEAGAMARRFPYQATSAARAAVNAGEVAFHDRHVSRLGDEVRYGHLVDVADSVALVEAVAVGEDWLVPSTSSGHTASYVAAADRLVVEVNDAQPRSLERIHDVYRRNLPPKRDPIPLSDPGERIADGRVRFDPAKLDAVVRSDRADSTYTFRDPTPDDRAIADNLAAFLRGELDDHPVLSSTVRVQFGVGSIGNAAAAALRKLDFGEREVAYFGEVIQDSVLDLLDDGVLRCASGTSLALSAEGQAQLFEGMERYADSVVLRPADVSNHPDLVDRMGVVGVNAALEVDVYGNANSTHLHGSHLMNGLGGSGDYNRNAMLPVVALPSTARGGEISRIVPMVHHVDHTEHDVSVVVTERGVADLRGLSPRERATEMVESCAHPDFRPALRRYLDAANENGGHVPHDVERAARWPAE
ncbi:MAG: acetyl-CoA hydrolase/transferase C-terminal domain-containing protein [Haloplanus sp.]